MTGGADDDDEGSVTEDDGDDDGDEHVDGLGEDISVEKLLVLNLRKSKKLRQGQAETDALFAKFAAGSNGRSAAPPAQRDARGPAARNAPRTSLRPTALPLDGLSRGLFSPGFRYARSARSRIRRREGGG